MPSACCGPGCERSGGSSPATPTSGSARSDVIANRLVQLVEQRTPAPRRVMTYDALPGEVDLAVFHDWCRARRIERFAPLVDPERPRRAPGRAGRRSTRASSTWWWCRAWRSRRTGTASARAAGTSTASCPVSASGCLRVGVCYREQLVDDVPSEPHDVVLDAVVSDADPAPTVRRREAEPAVARARCGGCRRRADPRLRRAVAAGGARRLPRGGGRLRGDDRARDRRCATGRTRGT